MSSTVRFESSGGMAAAVLAWLIGGMGMPGAAVAGPAAGPAGEAVVVLHGSSYWRVRHCWAYPLAKTQEGYAEIRPKPPYHGCKCQTEGFRFMATYPGRGWTEAEFDDSGWCRRPFYGRDDNGEVAPQYNAAGASNKLRQLCLRGKFTVTDPAKVKGLKVWVALRGGAIIYVNGKEIGRESLPPGDVQPGQPAEMYPRNVYLKADGKLVHWWHDRQTAPKEVYPLRVRTIEDVNVPGGLLRKGTNVLAIEIHAACFPAECVKLGAAWATADLLDVRLQADAPDGLVANVVRPRGLQVWNIDLLQDLCDVDYGDPHEALQPIRLGGARNGHYTGRLAVSSDVAIQGLKASVTELLGPAGRTIPASAVRIRYGTFLDKWPVGRGQLVGTMYTGFRRLCPEFTALDSPPGEVPVRKASLHSAYQKARNDAHLPGLVGGAVQSVWVTVHVPADAAAGPYRGKLTITLTGHEPISAGVRLTVCDWTVPEPRDFATFMGIIQSPDAVAMRYKVPMWSDEHWRRIGQSFELIGQLGGDVLFIPLTAESQYGNARSMVLWTKHEGRDAYIHDLSLIEKYVDVALKHMGRCRFVVVGVWDSCGRFGQRLRREYSRISVRDAKTGKVENIDGPVHASLANSEFWRPVLGGIRQMLAKRHLADAMVLGFGADVLPNMGVVTSLLKAMPDAGWEATRHFPTPKAGLRYDGGTVPVLYETNILGAWNNHDPDCRRVYGWRHGPGRAWMLRPLNDASPLPMVRVACEQALLADRPGQGQIGADFWPFADEKGRVHPTVYGRFPTTHEGAAGMFLRSLLYAGPDGPVPTLRYEIIRENLQECEARIFLEKLLVEKPCRLGEELARRCQDVLDERTRWHRMQQIAAAGNLTFAWSGWLARSIKLYDAAGEAARALGGR